MLWPFFFTLFLGILSYNLLDSYPRCLLSESCLLLCPILGKSEFFCFPFNNPVHVISVYFLTGALILFVDIQRFWYWNLLFGNPHEHSVFVHHPPSPGSWDQELGMSISNECQQRSSSTVVIVMINTARLHDFFISVWLLLDKGSLVFHGGERLGVLYHDSGLQCSLHQLQPSFKPILDHAAANERPCFLPGLHFNHSCSTVTKVISFWHC